MPKISVNAIDKDHVHRHPHAVPGMWRMKTKYVEQLADVEHREQRVGRAREVAFLLAVHADPKRGDDDPGEQHAFPFVHHAEAASAT